MPAAEDAPEPGQLSKGREGDEKRRKTDGRARSGHRRGHGTSIRIIISTTVCMPATTGVSWTIVRPVGLSDEPATGRYRLSRDGSLLPKTSRVSRADVAALARMTVVVEAAAGSGSLITVNQFTQAIANVLNLTFDEAEDLKIRVGLPDLDGTAAVSPGTDPELARAAQEALEREANKFIAEVRRSLDYYLTQATQIRTIRRILLTGSAAALGNMASYLEKGLQAQVVVTDPLAHLQVGPSSAGSVMADRLGCAPAIGLALGGVPQ